MSPRVAMQRRRLSLRLFVSGLVWSAGLLLAALLVPAYNGSFDSPDGGVTLTRRTLVQANGAWSLLAVVIPLIVSALCLAALRLGTGEREVEVVAGDAVFHVRAPRPEAARVRWAAWAGVGLLAVESVLGILTIGAFTLPAAVMLAAALRLAPQGAAGEEPERAPLPQARGKESDLPPPQARGKEPDLPAPQARLV